MRAAHQSGADILLALKDCFDSRPKLISGICLQDVSLPSAAQGCLYHVCVAVDTQEEYFRAGDDLAYLPCGLDSIQVGEAKAEQNQVWFQFADLLNCCQSICHFADESHLRMPFQH